MSETHGAEPGATAAVPATDPDEMKDAILGAAPQAGAADGERAPDERVVVDGPADPAPREAVEADIAGDAVEDEPRAETETDPQTETETGGAAEPGEAGEPGAEGADETADAPESRADGDTADVETGVAGDVETVDVETGDDEREPVGPEEPTYERFDCTGEDFSAGAEAARRAVERGECIVLPTDTVYGIGADAFSAEAVQRLLDAKERGRDMPPPVLIADTQMFKALADDVPQAALDLVERFWPGALTVICTMHANLELDLGEMEGTIALRVPDHRLARDLLRQTGPLAVSSANKTGLESAHTVDEAIGMLGNAVSVYLDGGALADPASDSVATDPARGLPSTIVDFTRQDHGEVLRVGAIPTEALQEVVPELVGPRTVTPLGTAADLAAAINALPEVATSPETPVEDEPLAEEGEGLDDSDRQEGELDRQEESESESPRREPPGPHA